MGDLRGCLLFAILGIFFPFIGGIIGCFSIGGWMLGVAGILYTIVSLWICTVLNEEKAGCVFYLLMIPFYILQIYGFCKGFANSSF